MFAILVGVPDFGWVSPILIGGCPRFCLDWWVSPILPILLARGHRWLHMLESGNKAGSLKEIAQKEGVDNSYVSRMVNLPLGIKAYP